MSHLIDAATASLKVDGQTDLRKLAATVRSVAAGSFDSSTLPSTVSDDGENLVVVADKAAPILAKLQGQAVSSPKPSNDTVTTDVSTVFDKPIVPVSEC